MSRWALPPLAPGDMMPAFSVASRYNPDFRFKTVAGHFIVLAFLPRDVAQRNAALQAFEAQRALFDDHRLAAFFVATDPEALERARDRRPGQRWFLDPDGALSLRFGARQADGADTPFWLLLDPALRILEKTPLSEAEAFFARVRALPSLDDYAETPLVAPALIVPRVFEPELCARLMAYYEARGGTPSGVMREVGGKTVGVVGEHKSRRDVTVEEPAFRAELLNRIQARLLPQIRRAQQFQATRIERYLVACYDAEERGRFGPHRDNETRGTAHRRFAVSINLNADFDGGDLRFPEFGSRTYRPPVGGAVVFCCSMMHEATPVTRGRRYAFLPFLYDEEAAQVREQNKAYVAPPPTG